MWTRMGEKGSKRRTKIVAKGDNIYANKVVEPIENRANGLG